ncbi:hypothetical protein [Williamsoniiplasma luminosum]|uniref:Uncharacterized protein n=1 Tax=Williamsoniiplasma luminosum TaxID=214888 RepID=A0A2S0NJR6_9MOLU|nr:hypothetical protein [Williamsoniiplasma luminosum]AVP49260.1 MAG: hypothetical protein C5T88_01535 [Williamsoniiplasma luminosum]
MEQIRNLNLILWIVDTTLIAIIAGGYLFYLRIYNNIIVPPINSAHDVIDSKSIENLVQSFLKLNNLDDYEVVFTDKYSHSKLFSNLKKHKKQILIGKRIFLSVGYELDYIISKIWLSAKEIKKDRCIIFYKLSIKWFNISLLLIFFLAYLLQAVTTFGAMLMDDNTHLSDALYTIFITPIWTILIFVVLVLFLLNYLLSKKIKEQIELDYNQETVLAFKNTLPQYHFDFTTARQMAIENKYPLLHMGRKTTKWFGPFVY